MLQSQLAAAAATAGSFSNGLALACRCAAVQEIPGVPAVLGMRVRSRGRFVFDDFATLTLDVDSDDVIRLENDPTHPERGSLRVVTEGGV